MRSFRPLLVPLIAVLAACGGSELTTTQPPLATLPDPAAVKASVDWSARTIVISGPTDFDVSFCDGDAPLLCVEHDNTLLGVVESRSSR